MEVKKQSQRSIEAQALYFAFITSGLAAVLAAARFFKTDVPFFGSPSIGTVSAVLAALSTIVLFFMPHFMAQYAGAKRKKHKALSITAKEFVATFSLAFIHAALVFLLTTGLFYLLSLAFVGLLQDWVTASVMTGATVGATSYLTYISAANLTTVRLSGVLALFVVSGALTSMITTSDPDWWQLHFSSLGGGDSALSRITFNATLIIGGLVIVALADYIANDFSRLKSLKKQYKDVRVNVVRGALAFIGVFLAMVGLFQYDVSVQLHNNAAAGMAFIFLGLTLGIPWIAPGFSRAFYVFTYSMMASLLVGLWLLVGPLSYFNLTAFELLCAGVIFTWLVVFIRQVAALLEDQK
ncbi:MAG TPA: hypothetical protein PL051_02710 [Candidatus Saccharibacteria bacterium]|nr:hypothetical protein [Candidatus Saccharibacteria bacterium]